MKNEKLQSINNQYLQLAAFLGDIEFKINQHCKEIDKLIGAKESTIESINALNLLAAKVGNVNLETAKAKKELK